MKREKLVPSPMKKRHKALFLIVFAAAALFFSHAAQAQSGRRQSKGASPTPPPVAVEPKDEPAAATPPAVKPAPAANVIVAGDRHGDSLMLIFKYVDEAVMACIDRLKESTGLEVIAGGHMTRADAVARAKKEQGAYVLWLEVSLEDDPGQETLVISYRVYMPQTAKSLTSGRVYPGSRSAASGRVGVGVPGISRRLPIQYLMKEGGREVADRVRSKLSASSPD